MTAAPRQTEASQTPVHPLVAAARGLVPAIRANVERIEQERRLPDELVQALAESGIPRMLVPTSLGGGEVDPITQMEVLEALAYADGSVGWVASIASGTAWATSFLRPEVATELLRDPGAIIVGSFGSPFGGRAVAVDGGYRVSGRWPFASGSPHATWLVGHSAVIDGDTPRLGPTGAPLTRVMIFPAAEATILDTWSATGLAGSGSHDFTVEDVFVPEELSFVLYGAPEFQTGPLYKARFFLLAHGAHALGIARAAIDAFLELATEKREAPTGVLVRNRAHVQVAVAQAEALVRGGRAYLWEATRQVWDEVCSTGAITPQNRALLRLAISSSFDNAMKSVDLMYTAGGGASVYRRNSLQRYFRDIHTVSQHSIVAPVSYEQTGQWLLSVSAGVTPTGRPLI
jgi:alkylation response protein AidB-like acyl-CoA dehydrogenase